jgi:hypothetical protein
MYKVKINKLLTMVGCLALDFRGVSQLPGA